MYPTSRFCPIAGTFPEFLADAYAKSRRSGGGPLSSGAAALLVTSLSPRSGMGICIAAPTDIGGDVVDGAADQQAELSQKRLALAIRV